MITGFVRVLTIVLLWGLSGRGLASHLDPRNYIAWEVDYNLFNDAQGRLYGKSRTSGESQNQLVRLNPFDGQALWTQSFPIGPPGPIKKFCKDKNALVIQKGGTIARLSVLDGTLLWTTDLPGVILLKGEELSIDLLQCESSFILLQYQLGNIGPRFVTIIEPKRGLTLWTRQLKRGETYLSDLTKKSSMFLLRHIDRNTTELTSLSLESGELQHQTILKDQSLLYDRLGRAFAIEGTRDLNHNILRIDLNRGGYLWRSPYRHRGAVYFDNYGPFIHRPDNKLVFFEIESGRATGVYEPKEALQAPNISFQGHLGLRMVALYAYAQYTELLDRKTGEVLWRLDLKGAAKAQFIGIAGDLWIFRSGLYWIAVDPWSGTEKWRLDGPLDGPNLEDSPRLMDFLGSKDDRLYFSCGMAQGPGFRVPMGFGAISIKSGRIIWQAWTEAYLSLKYQDDLHLYIEKTDCAEGVCEGTPTTFAFRK